MLSRVHWLGLCGAVVLIALGLYWPVEPVPAEEERLIVEPLPHQPESLSDARYGHSSEARAETEAPETTRILVSPELKSEAWVPGDLEENYVVGDQVGRSSVQEVKGEGSADDE